jgi:hypothetical protein
MRRQNAAAGYCGDARYALQLATVAKKTYDAEMKQGGTKAPTRKRQTEFCWHASPSMDDQWRRELRFKTL